MANTLDKFGVPLPSGSNKTIGQPKPKYRFRVVMYDFGINNTDKDYMALEAETVDRPSISFSTQTIKMFGTNTSYVGSRDWKPITLTVRESVDNKSIKAVYRQIQKQLDFQRRISPRSQQSYGSYKFRMMIETLGGANPDDTVTNLLRDTAVDAATAITNNLGLVDSIDSYINGEGYNATSTIDRWVCYGCMLSDISFDSLDYADSKYVTIKLTIKPDNCVSYDMYEEMYSDKVSSLLSDKTNNALTVIDNLIGNIVL